MQRYFAAFCQIFDENFRLFAIIDYWKCLVDAPVTVKDVPHFCSIIDENEILNALRDTNYMIKLFDLLQ